MTSPVTSPVSTPVPPPPALRTDASNAFAHFSMKVRVPRIARDVLDRETDLPVRVRAAIERLAADVEGDAPLPPPRPPAAAIDAWVTAHAARAGESWLATQWFYAELAFYRELARACRFWETGRDPFTGAKEEELAGDRPWDRLGAALASGGGDRRDERVFRLLDEALWGNRVDLSYAVAASRARADDDLLADERAAAVPYLVRAGADVHLVADNTGTELALDLALVDAVLEDPAARVTLHLKMEPVFVSDAMPRDVWRILEAMRGRGGDVERLADRLATSFDAERLVLAPDPFWSGPSFLWSAPPSVRASLASATFVVVKGDANYRRVIGDAMWPATASFTDACAYAPAPLLCLRTMKSDAIAGLPSPTITHLDATEPRWRIDGRRGLAQSFIPASNR